MSTADSSWHATSSNVSSSSAHYYQPTSSMGSNTSSLAKLLLDAPTAAGGLKRRATSPPREASPGPSTRKRVKVEGEAWTQGEASSSSGSTAVDGRRLLGDLTEELECPCCSATVYRPVIVLLCQHFFCGSCITLWIQNGGTHCPKCRSQDPSNHVQPSRVLESLVSLLLRNDPSLARTVAEREQADEVYTGGALRIPMPRDSSPPPVIPQSNSDYARPCPHCVPNPYGYRCPQPVRDPVADPEHAWHLDDGNPPGHAYCGNCEDLLAIDAPSTSRCDTCQVAFCGIGAGDRCSTAPLLTQHTHNYASVSDLLQAPEVYECFDGNTVEVDFLLEYLAQQQITPRDVYRGIVSHLLRTPAGLLPLIDMGLFDDIYPVSGRTDPSPAAPRQHICRRCAGEVLLWGLREWWARERARGNVSAAVLNRPTCPQLRACERQRDTEHAKQFNHVPDPPSLPGGTPVPGSPAEAPREMVPMRRSYSALRFHHMMQHEMFRDPEDLDVTL